MDKPATFSLVIPTYNEAANIEEACRRLDAVLTAQKIGFEIIIVDDDSPDLTWKKAQEMAAKNRRIRVIRRTSYKGLATAVVEGWKNASGDILGVIDGDLQHPPETVPALLDALAASPMTDIAIASRNTIGGKVSRWVFWRRLISRLGALISAFFLPELLAKVSDPMSGFFILRKKVLENRALTPSGYKILLEVLAKGTYRAVTEVPYTFDERKKGGSKAGIRQYGLALGHILRLSFQTKEFFRIIKYVVVGTAGALLTVDVYLLLSRLGMKDFPAYAVALEAAIINNFLFNDLWTFKDKARLAGREKIKQFVKFNLICLNGAAVSFLVLIFLLLAVKVPSVYALTFAAASGFLWNFMISANSVWLSEFTYLKHRTEPGKGYYHSVLLKNKVQRYWHHKKFGLVYERIDAFPVLDIGSGPGVFASLFRDKDGIIINADSSLEQLEYSSNLNPGVFCVNADASNLPFLSRSLDTVTLIETIEHIPEERIVPILSEIRRVLKDSGKLVVTTPNYRSLWPVLETIISVIGPVDYRVLHKTHFDRRRLARLLNDSGFQVNRCSTHFLISPFLSLISGILADAVFSIEEKISGGAGCIIVADARKDSGAGPPEKPGAGFPQKAGGSRD